MKPELERAIEQAIDEANNRLKAVTIAGGFIKQHGEENPTVLLEAIAMAQAILKQQTESSSIVAPAPTLASEQTANGMNQLRTRKEQVIDFLQSHGPAAPREIMASTGVPQGTLSWVLSDRKIFVNQNGKWGLVQEAAGVNLSVYPLVPGSESGTH
jgi:hypothetical protein